VSLSLGKKDQTKANGHELAQCKYQAICPPTPNTAHQTISSAKSEVNSSINTNKTSRNREFEIIVEFGHCPPVLVDPAPPDVCVKCPFQPLFLSIFFRQTENEASYKDW
jgi:hypothetical protein